MHQSSNIVSLEQVWRSYLNRGLRSLEEGQYYNALLAFERALQEAPHEPQVLLAVGRERMRQGRFDEAETYLREAWERQKTSTATAAAFARLLGLHQGKIDEADAVIEKSLELAADQRPLIVIRGELLLERGDYRAARAAFESALGNEELSHTCRLGLARTFNAEGIDLSQQGNCEQAIFAFKRATDLDPQWSGPLVNLGVAFGRLNKPTKALEAYQQALERDHHNPVAHYNLATLLQEIGRPAEAVSVFEELMHLAPEYPAVRSALANALGELKEFDRAIALLLEELEIDEDSVSAWSSLGLAYICTGNHERGEQCLRQALAIDPGYFNALHNLASLYLAQKRLTEAEEILRCAMTVAPLQTKQIVTKEPQFAELASRCGLEF